MCALVVQSANPVDDPGWDGFARSHPSSTAYHLAAWSRILCRSYRYRLASLKLVDGSGVTRGILPLMYRRGPVSGRRLRSMPVVPTAGPLAETQEGAAMLLEHARDQADQRGADLVVESRLEGLDRMVSGIHHFERPPSWILDLSFGDLTTWLADRPKNLARSIRKAARSGLSVREASSEDDLRSFYRLYVATMRRHRSLPRLYRHFRLAHELLQRQGILRLFVVDLEGRQVAGGLFHSYRDTIELLYNASDPGSLSLRPNHALFRLVTEWALERDLESLDFGFAWPGSSLASFKEQWGASVVMEHGYTYSPHENGGREHPGWVTPPAPTALPSRLPSAFWDRVPLPLTRVTAAIAYRYL